jgi:electron transfer flavoprotein beta subunit
VLAAAIKRADPGPGAHGHRVDRRLHRHHPGPGRRALGLPSITFAKKIAVDGSTVKVERQTEAGYDEVESPLPAVVTVTAGVVEPRYPSFKGIMAAKSKPVDNLTWPTSASRPSPGRRGRGRPGDHRRLRRSKPAAGGEIVVDEGTAPQRIVTSSKN